MKIEHSAITDTGMVRKENQDSYAIVPETGFFAVLDGMGGAAAGDFASRAAAQIMIAAIPRLTTDEIDGIVRLELPEKAKRICAAIRLANRSLHCMVDKYPRLSGMGTTVASIVIDEEEGTAHIIHVGDSRLYRFRYGILELLTSDHSKINELISLGKMSREDARTAEIQSMITRALGTCSTVKIDCLSVPIVEGDQFILCTDGLNGELEDGEIAGIAGLYAGNNAKAARKLVEAANQAGGRDNTTVLSLRVSGTGLGDPAVEESCRPLIIDDEIPAETAVEDALVKKFISLAGIRIPRMAKDGNLLLNPLTIGAGVAFLAAVAVILPSRLDRRPCVTLDDLSGNISGVSLEVRQPSSSQLEAFKKAQDSIQELQAIQDWKKDKRNNTVFMENVQVLVEENGKDQFLFNGVTVDGPLNIKLKQGLYTLHLKYPGYRLISEKKELTNDIAVVVEPGNELKPLVVIMIPYTEKGAERERKSPEGADNRRQ